MSVHRLYVRPYRQCDARYLHCESLSEFAGRLFSLLDTSTADVLGLFYLRLWELPIVVAMACVIGALGILFVDINSRVVCVLRNRFIPSSSRFRSADSPLPSFITSSCCPHNCNLPSLCFMLL